MKFRVGERVWAKDWKTHALSWMLPPDLKTTLNLAHFDI